MVIVINTRLLIVAANDAGFYQEVFLRIAQQQPIHDFIFIAEKDFFSNYTGLKNIKTLIVDKHSNNPLKWKLWYQFQLPALAKKLNADLLFNMDVSCALSGGLPQCILVKDLELLEHPSWFSKKSDRFLSRHLKNFFNKAARVIVASNVLQEKLAKQFLLPANKMAVVNPGIDLSYLPFTEHQRENIKMKLSEGKEYFLYIGSLLPQSNLINLLKAFSVFKKRQKTNMQLLIVNTGLETETEFTKALQLYKYRNEVKIINDVTDLKSITASAYAVTSAAYFEEDMGVLLNALPCKVPLLVSNSKTNNEILGDAAYYADSDLADEIASKMMLLFKDEAARNRVIENGQVQAIKYNWDKTAETIWQQILLSMA